MDFSNISLKCIIFGWRFSEQFRNSSNFDYNEVGSQTSLSSNILSQTSLNSKLSERFNNTSDECLDHKVYHILFLLLIL